MKNCISSAFPIADWELERHIRKHNKGKSFVVVDLNAKSNGGYYSTYKIF